MLIKTQNFRKEKRRDERNEKQILHTLPQKSKRRQRKNCAMINREKKERTGDPNGRDAGGAPMPECPAYTEKKPFVMHLHEDRAKLGAKEDEPDELTKIFVDYFANCAQKS